MAAVNKMAVLILIVISLFAIKAHHYDYRTAEPKNVNNEISSDSSSDSNADNVLSHGVSYKRNNHKGLSIEVPKRALSLSIENGKSSAETKPKTTTTTFAQPDYPPLDPKYRRIYNPDEKAAIDQYPFMAAILVNGQLWCGGAIIDKDRVLTAAHCLQLQYNNRFFREYMKLLTVRVGSTNATSGGELFEVRAITFHPNYQPKTLQNNLAILTLHKSLKLSHNSNDSRTKNNIDSIKLATDVAMPVDSKIKFLGWGSVLSFGGTGGRVLLQKITLPLYDLADCQGIYGRDLVTRSNFCAGFISEAKNVCNHDAGGPALANGMLAGVLSFSSRLCNRPDTPAVFTSVSSASDWLEKILLSKP